ncbi:MAG: hypothetical protein M2R45_01571 [Verrucomicrobia subdivision 3 bacterium]|nr:hypothetical protein [Limisphaerales bacterium]MCS1413303.1 hypothetical protein [Limisphaerales bacterium]
MSQRERRRLSGEEKMKTLQVHLVEGKAASDLCDAHRISPNLFYQWRRTFFENGAKAFEGRGNTSKQSQTETRIKMLERKLQRKHEDLSELMEAPVRLKKWELSVGLHVFASSIFGGRLPWPEDFAAFMTSLLADGFIPAAGWR